MKNFIKTGVTVNNTHLNWLIAILLCSNISTSSLAHAKSKEHSRVIMGRLESCSIPQHIQFLYELKSTGSRCDDLNKAVQLLVQKLNSKDSQENVAAFLKEIRSLPENIKNKIRNELLQSTPEFYKSFVDHQRDLITEEQFNENIVIRKHWNSVEESQRHYDYVEFYTIIFT